MEASVRDDAKKCDDEYGSLFCTAGLDGNEPEDAAS